MQVKRQRKADAHRDVGTHVRMSFKEPRTRELHLKPPGLPTELTLLVQRKERAILRTRRATRSLLMADAAIMAQRGFQRFLGTTARWYRIGSNCSFLFCFHFRGFVCLQPRYDEYFLSFAVFQGKEDESAIFEAHVNLNGKGRVEISKRSGSILNNTLFI